MVTYKITFEPRPVVVVADPARYPYGSHGKPGSLLDIALAHGVPINHACGGVGACSTCHVVVLEGAENLSAPSDEELDMIDNAPGHTPESRLACMAVVKGDVRVRIPTWNRNLVAEE